MQRNRKIIMLGQQMEVPERRAEMLVQRGQAQYLETATMPSGDNAALQPKRANGKQKAPSKGTET